ncbi:MAG TPA: hypothetical protein VGQ57_16335, partial [Polyangiaceae bacterium]|nr:hypothetical protein [Polyangiaceae bacterium]
RLAAEVDPRQALTELKLVAPPLRPHRDWIVPVALAVLAVGFICLWWVTPNPASRAAAPAVEPAAPRVTPNTPVEPREQPAPLVTATPTVLGPAGPTEPPDVATTSDALPDAPTTDTVSSPSTKSSPPPPATSGKAPRHPKVARDPWLE